MKDERTTNSEFDFTAILEKMSRELRDRIEARGYEPVYDAVPVMQVDPDDSNMVTFALDCVPAVRPCVQGEGIRHHGRESSDCEYCNAGRSAAKRFDEEN